MSKTAKIIVGLIVLILVIWGISTTMKSTPTVKEPIKIGFIGALSADAAAFGDTEKAAIQIALDQINSSGGIGGRQVQVIYEDGKCNGKDAISAASKLINIDQVKVIMGGLCSSETLAIAPIAEQNKVILFSAFSSNPAITNSGDYIFRNSPSDSDVAKLDAQTILQKGYKKLAILSESNDYAEGVRNVMKSIFASSTISVVFDETFTGNTSDFRNFIVKIKQSGADVVYINPGSSGKTGALFVKQLRQTGSKIAVHGNFSLGTPDSFSIGGGYLNGMVISDSAAANSTLMSLLDAYKAKTGNKVANDFEFGASYDRMMILAKAIEASGYDADKIKGYLYNMQEYDGAIGKYKFDSNGDVTGGPFFVNYLIKDGQKVPYQN